MNRTATDALSQPVSHGRTSGSTDEPRVFHKVNTYKWATMFLLTYQKGNDASTMEGQGPFPSLRDVIHKFVLQITRWEKPWSGHRVTTAPGHEWHRPMLASGPHDHQAPCRRSRPPPSAACPSSRTGPAPPRLRSAATGGARRRRSPRRAPGCRPGPRSAG